MGGRDTYDAVASSQTLHRKHKSQGDTVPIPGRIFPIDPTIGADGGKYRYQVVVRITCGPDSNETIVFMDYDTIPAGTQVIDDAIESYRTGVYDTPYSPPPAIGDTGQCVYTGRIVSVGRRSDVPMFPTGSQ